MIIKLKLLALLISMIFVSCGPQILNRPLTNNSKQVFTVLNQIKYSKKDEYKDLLYDKVIPALRAYKDISDEKDKLNQMVNDGMYVIEPKSIGDDSTWMFVYIVNPYIKGANYNIIPPLKQMYGDKEAKEIFKRWNKCYSSKQIAYWSSDDIAKIK